jgi:hypothetical protein
MPRMSREDRTKRMEASSSLPHSQLGTRYRLARPPRLNVNRP